MICWSDCAQNIDNHWTQTFQPKTSSWIDVSYLLKICLQTLNSQPTSLKPALILWDLKFLTKSLSFATFFYGFMLVVISVTCCTHRLRPKCLFNKCFPPSFQAATGHCTFFLFNQTISTTKICCHWPLYFFFSTKQKVQKNATPGRCTLCWFSCIAINNIKYSQEM